MVAGQIYCDENSKKHLNVFWETKIPSGEINGTHPQACAFNKNNFSLIVIGISYQIDKDLESDAEGELYMWELDTQEGIVIKKTLINKLPKISKGLMSTFKFINGDIYIDSNEDIFAITDFKRTKPTLTRIYKNKKEIFSMDSLTKGDATNFFAEQISKLKMISLLDDTFLLSLSSLSGKSVLAKLNKEGKKIWEKVYTDERQKIFIDDGIPITKQGDFVGVKLITREIESPESLSDIWLFCCDPNANILTEDIFPGNSPHICRLVSGEIVVIYNASANLKLDMNNTDYRLKIYNPELKLLSENQILKGRLIFPLKIKALADGNFITVGTIAPKPELGEKLKTVIEAYDKQGHKLDRLVLENVFGTDISLCENGKNRLFIVTKSYPLIEELLSNKFSIKVVAVELK